MATALEKRLSQRKRRSGILVPLLEDLFTRPVEVEDEHDAEWVWALMTKQLHRERTRKLNKTYSPSSLASCLRQVYLAKHYKELDIKRLVTTRIEPNFYFATGDWVHMKWQFALWKLSHKYPKEKFHLWGVEIPVSSKHGDHSGTIDAIFSVNGEYHIADFKGVNVRTFQKAEVGEIEHKYALQISDYAMLANADQTLHIPKISKALLVYENKGGPTARRPIALCEVEVPVKEHLPEIRFRLKELRYHEKNNSIPEPECERTKSIQFTDCPFRKFCKAEVERIESRNPTKREVAVSTKRRANRSRRSKP